MNPVRKLRLTSSLCFARTGTGRSASQGSWQKIETSVASDSQRAQECPFHPSGKSGGAEAQRLRIQGITWKSFRETAEGSTAFASMTNGEFVFGGAKEMLTTWRFRFIRVRFSWKSF